MKQGVFEITESVPLTPEIFRLRLRGDVSGLTVPGQFVNLQLDGFFLRRPFSVCDVGADFFDIICQVVGRGTERLRKLSPGTRLDVLTGLGNGFDTALSGDAPLLIGGGVGAAPLYWLARCLVSEGKRPRAALGFNNREGVFYEAEFRALCESVSVATADGSYGRRGFVTDVLGEGYSHFFACGPEAMLRAVCRTAAGAGQLSFDARMGCGFGACMGCTCKTVTGGKRICRDGPVLRREEIVWDD